MSLIRDYTANGPECYVSEAAMMDLMDTALGTEVWAASVRSQRNGGGALAHRTLEEFCKHLQSTALSLAKSGLVDISRPSEKKKASSVFAATSVALYPPYINNDAESAMELQRMNVNNISFMKAAYESGTRVDPHGYEYAIDVYGDERYFEEPWPVAYCEERYDPCSGRGRGHGGYLRGRGSSRGSFGGSREAGFSRPPYNPPRSFSPGPPGACYDCGQLGHFQGSPLCTGLPSGSPTAERVAPPFEKAFEHSPATVCLYEGTQGPRVSEQEYSKMRQELSALQNERAVAVNHAQALAVTPLSNSDADRDCADTDRDQAHRAADHFWDRHEYGVGTDFHRARTS
jgi:hypothetical protein